MMLSTTSNLDRLRQFHALQNCSFSAVSFTTSREGYYAMLQVMRPADVVDHWVLTNQLIVAKHCELGLDRIYAKTADGICISNLDI